MQGLTYGLPGRLPPIKVARTKEAAPTVDCRELRWMFITPDVDREYAWGIYDAPDWTLTNLTHIQGIARAQVHGVPCVQVQGVDWELQEGTWQNIGQTDFFVAEKENSIDMVATWEQSESRAKFQSFYDEGFFERWGKSQRRLSDLGDLTSVGEGVWQMQPGSSVACDGTYAVTIGNKTFTTLRCLDLTLDVDNPDCSVLIEAFLTQDGYTLLARRYNAPLWQIRDGGYWGTISWDKRFPDHTKILVNGIQFVHWYDAVGQIAFA